MILLLSCFLLLLVILSIPAINITGDFVFLEFSMKLHLMIFISDKIFDGRKMDRKNL